MEVGFVDEFEDIFWVFDDTSEVWMARHFNGRRLRRGNPKGGGKGKGHKGFKKFVPFWKKKGKGKGKGDNDAAAHATWQKGKGKSKGSGKGKAKRKGEKGDGQQDATGKGAPGKTWTTEGSTPAESPTPAAQADSTTWESEAWWGAEWSEGSFFVEDRTKEIAHTFLMQYQSGASSSWEAIDIKQNPTFVVLDLGCTRAMGSRHAVTAFIQMCGQFGITYQFFPSDAHFSFANSQTAIVKEKIRIYLPTKPPCWTEFDILEQGHVPILFSLPQMKNLYFNIELTPEVSYLTCTAFGFIREPIRSSTTRHLVVDLSKLRGRANGLEVRGNMRGFTLDPHSRSQ